MPSHDESSPIAPRAGSVRRPPPARARNTGGGGGRGSGRPPAGGRARTTAARSGGGTPPRPTGSRPAGARPAAKGGKPRGSTGARSTKQKRHHRLKIAGTVLGGMLLLLGVFVGVVYASTEVPSPDSITTAQTTVVYYADGTTEMARLGDENRTNVALDEISEPAQNAVLAAENRSFYSDPGISLTGILRATWNNLTGGSTQGGSTITQQYVKNAILQNSEQTFSRKFQELFLSIKLDNNYTKQQILENYLNTIYYGRGAYGIEAASNTYFGVPASELTAQQGAVLAVLIRSPSRYDPELSPDEAQDRWERVLDAMVEEGWLTAEEREASVYPPVLPKAASSLGMPSGPEGLIVGRVLDELESVHGYDEQQIRAGGLRITSTVDRAMQDAAVTAVNEVMAGEPEGLREALVAVDPRTGAVKAYYGGEIGAGDGAIDYARAQRQPGSSVKPYVLATALEQGISVNARRDGSSPQVFPDREAPVRNSGGVSCGACTLREAITRSLNTTFYGLAYEVGPDNVAETAREASGLPDVWDEGSDLLVGVPTLSNPTTGNVGSSVGIGEYEMRPVDQAVGFATFASGGVQRDPYVVARVADNEGAVLLENAGDPGEQVLEADIANDVSYALKDVASHSRRSLDGGREVASKTGTQGLNAEDNSDAWMVGYTPSLSAAVWVGNDNPNEPIVNARGQIVYGAGLPGAIWQQFMNTALAGTPEEDLPDSAIIRGDTGEGVPEPAPAPAPTREAPATSSAPAPAPTPTPDPEPVEPPDPVVPPGEQPPGGPPGPPVVPPGQQQPAAGTAGPPGDGPAPEGG